MDNTKLHTSLCNSIRSYVSLHGGYLYKNIGALGQVRGRPDMDGCLKGRFLAIEAKTGTGKQSEDQRREQICIEETGGIYILARSLDDVEARLLAEGLVIKRSLF